MQKRVSKTSLVRRAGALAVAGAATAALAGLGAGSAQADVGPNLPDNCREFSKDGGSTWGDSTEIDWNTSIRPSPGAEALYASFHVRNKCDKPAKLQAMVGNWVITDGGSANVRADVGSVKSPLTRLQGEKPILLAETGRLAKNQSIPVKFYVGLPADETKQGFKITPGFRLYLEEVEPGAPVDPPGDGGGSGSSGSSTGSLGDLFGDLGGSLASKSVGKSTGGASLNAPAVTAGR